MPGDLHQWLVTADMKAWYMLHATWRNAALDTVMPYLRNPFLWAPAYLFLLVYMAKKGGRHSLYWCVGFSLCFVLGDQISAHLIKPFFHRLRPCNDPRLTQALHLIVERSSGYSFPSSHATNHFAMATFIAATIGRKHFWVVPVVFLWALSICYAQVYVGVHFPGDVAAGALLGLAIGGLLVLAYRRAIRPKPAGVMLHPS